MNKSALWCIPFSFFLVAVTLNLIGSIQGTELANVVKPVLLPLLSASTLAYLVGKDYVDMRATALLVAGQLFGCVGDVLLIPGDFPFFVSGMAAFLVGHVCYMCVFGGQSWRGLTVWQWAISLILLCAALAALIWHIGVEGPLFFPMVFYGFALMMLIFSALAGVLRMPNGRRGAWWILFFGTILFALSDSCIALNIFSGIVIPQYDLVVMATYIAAQTLLAVGGIRLILGK
ncbi:MAG: lysoplasmalogenase [Bacteroidales bacterium]|nr:lysoplasmalogenase [Bacteroidales bacterium]